jgi:hypothetical protein
MPIAWAEPCSNFGTDEHRLSAKNFRRIHTILQAYNVTVPTLMSIGAIRKTLGLPLKDED